MVRILLGCVAMAFCTVALAGDATKDKAPVAMIKAGDAGVVKATIKSGNVEEGWVVTYKDADGKEQEVKVASETKTCADCACGDDKAKAKSMKEKHFVKGTAVLVKLADKKVEMMVYDFESNKKDKN